MIRTYTLRPVQDECIGDWGWVLATMPDSVNDGTEPVIADGRLIAHDVLEHSAPHLIGGPSDEIRALGASMYIRGEGNGYGGYDRDPLYVLGGDLQRMLRYPLDMGERLNVPRRRPRPEPWAREIVRYAWEYYRAEISPIERDARPGLAYFLRPTLRDAAILLQLGYDRARRRWPLPSGVRRLFNEITTVVDAVQRRNDAREASAYGWTIKLRVDYDEYLARAWIEEPPYSEDDA